MTTTELRVKVAEAMGYSDINPDGRMWGERDDGFVECMTGYTNRDGVRYGPFEVPNFGAPSWEATGAVLDEIKRRGTGLWLFRANPPETLVCVEPSRTMPSVQRIDQCIHRAICLAFLEAHARAKEPHDAR